MKQAWVVILFALLAIGLAVWCGDRLISSHHTVGRYTFALPSSNSATIAGGVIWEGMQLALQSCGMNPRPWAVSPSSEWQLSDTLQRTNENRVPVLVILSNQTDRTELYVRVESVAGAGALEYHLYRPK